MDTAAPTLKSAATGAKPASPPVEPDRISELYRGEIFTEESSQVARDRIHWMCSQCRGDEILDVGCSQGITAILVAREGFRVTAIDTHSDSVSFARAEIARENSFVQARITLLESDLASLPAEPGFDTILLGEVLEHQSIPLRLLQQAKRRLRADGVLVITTPFALHPHSDHKVSLFPRDLVSFAREVGLAVNLLEANDGYIRVVMGASGSASAVLDEAELLRLTEQATLRSQATLYGQLSQRSDQLKKRSDALKIAQRKLAEATSAAELQVRELEAGLKALRAQHAESLDAFAERQRALESKMEGALSERDRVHAAELVSLCEQHQAALAAQVKQHQAALAVQVKQHQAALAVQIEQQRQNEASMKAAALEQAKRAAEALRREHDQALGAAEQKWREQLDSQQQQLLANAAKFERLSKADREALVNLKSELVTHRHEIVRLKARCESVKQRADRLADRSDRLKEQADTLRSAGQAVKASTSYRLGRLIVKGMKSPSGFLALPGGLLSLGRDVLKRRRGSVPPASLSTGPGAVAALPAARVAPASIEDRGVSDSVDGSAAPAGGVRAPKASARADVRQGTLSAAAGRPSPAAVSRVDPKPNGTSPSNAIKRGPGAESKRSASVVRDKPKPKPKATNTVVAEAPVAVDPLAPDLLKPHLDAGGVSAVKDHLASLGGSFKPLELALALLKLGKAVSKSAGPEIDFALAEAALKLDRSELVLRGYFWAAQRTLRIEAAYRAYSEFEALALREPNPTHAGYLEKLGRSPIVQLSLLNLVGQQKGDPIEPVPRRICYVLHNSLPYSSGGYATRAHGVCGGLKEAGYEVIVLTRPGFPLDTKPELTAADVAPEDVVDGIRFVRTLAPQRSAGVPIVPYVSTASEAMEARLREWRPEIVVAASNYRTALPALIAARRLGIPFIYEVRGFWEVTRISRDPEYANTAAYATQSLLEARVAQLSDHVFTLTEPMREELVLRGVPADKVDLLPNSCDPSRFVPRSRDQALANRLGIPEGTTVIGYVGTFVDYEGLEDLALACANLKARGLTFRLLLVGNENASGTNRGPITEEILRIADSEGLRDWLIMPGRVPHEEVEAYYSLIDIAAFPRKPWPVCEMVSPMKPLEALATEKAVLVSSVRALTELIADGKTGCVFEKGNIASMTDKLALLIADPALRQTLGRSGREWVIDQRTWTRVGQTLAKRFAVLSKTTPLAPAQQHRTVQISSAKPRWWNKIDEGFRERCEYVDLTAFRPEADVAKLRASYVQKFGEEAVARRMPAPNWARADICARIVAPSDSLLDVGSGLGEFVNLIAMRKIHGSVTSVDRKDYDLWMDASGSLQRVYKDLFKLDASHARSVVTCFEVIEHLAPDQVAHAVEHLRSLAKERLYVSVPFLEPLPLYRGHFTRFDHVNLAALFPDARMTVFGKANDDEVRAWILCEVDRRQPANENVAR